LLQVTALTAFSAVSWYENGLLTKASGACQ
jgi:hypothetical protein